jgi:hypothetical protein
MPEITGQVDGPGDSDSLLVALVFIAQHKYLGDRLLVGTVED